MKQEKLRYVAKCLAGLEPLLCAELEKMGFEEVKELNRGAEFVTDYKGMVRANMACRYAIRILQPFHEDTVKNADQLYMACKRLPWKQVLNNQSTFAVHATTKSDDFQHSHYTALRVKDAIVDQFREKTGRRPSIDTDNPDLRIDVNIIGNTLRVSLDTSGDSLHRRGYRPPAAKAPLNECLAAAMIAYSGWTPDEVLYVPMCGSGTLVMEAAMLAADLPSQWFRPHYGFMNWPNADKKAIMEVRQDLWVNRKPQHTVIIASDIERNAVRQTQDCISRLSWEHEISVSQGDFFELPQPEKPGVVILNPPYGERMRPENIEIWYRNIGRKLKTDFVGCRAWIISSNLEAYKHIGFKAYGKHTLYNGQLECRYAGFELYEGSIKDQAQA